MFKVASMGSCKDYMAPKEDYKVIIIIKVGIILIKD
jgi:hypothetical protein